MPPRKSDVAKVTEGEDGGTPAKESAAARDGVNIECGEQGRGLMVVQDLNLPKSIVTRLAKGVLPPNTQIQGNAMLAMTKSATVFINYLASHANDHAASANRKTIAPQDVLKALDELEFPDFKPRLEAELAKFNENQTDKRNAYRKKVASEKASGKPASDNEGEHEEAGGGKGSPRPRKRGGSEEEGDAEEEEQQEDTEEEDENEAEEENHDDRGEEDERKEEEDEAMDNGEDSD
ncbi:histone-fold-containing protein [Bisporella sp. PMI_857]|nr:histone-fold-containing protein [Bisporella sp. PMI_857]